MMMCSNVEVTGGAPIGEASGGPQGYASPSHLMFTVPLCFALSASMVG